LLFAALAAAREGGREGATREAREADGTKEGIASRQTD